MLPGTLLRKTIVRLWLERVERRNESEGKEWASMFPGGVKLRMRGGDEVGRSGQHCGATARFASGKPAQFTHSTWSMDAQVLMNTLKSSCYYWKKRIMPEKEWVVHSWGSASSWNTAQDFNECCTQLLFVPVWMYTSVLVFECACLSYGVSVGAACALPPLLSTESWLSLARERTNV